MQSSNLYRKYIKRALDIILSGIALVLLSPVILAITIILWIAYRGESPFFTQRRPGYKCKIFKVVKFRTMNNTRDKDGNLLHDDLRMTRIGKLVRSTSLDELPQFWNVFVGDMSLIGPRPLLEKYIPLYSPEQMRRHDVRPGISGWAQCNGRNAISWANKFEYDIWYVDHISFLVDCKIIYKTIINALKADGITQEGSSTAEAFNGHN